MKACVSHLLFCQGKALRAPVTSCRHSKAPFTFIMQIMFGNPSLSLTFSWAAPDQGNVLTSNPSPSTKSGGCSPSSSSTDGFGTIDEKLLGKPFELTLARQAPPPLPPPPPALKRQ